MNTTADSLASGALGLALAALAWLVAHSAQLKRLVELLPGIAADAAKAKATVDTQGLGPAVSRVEATLSAESQAALNKVLAALERQVTPMAEPIADSSPAPATATETAPDAPAGLAEGGTYAVRDGKLIPTGS